MKHKCDTQKIQLTVAINFVSSEDNDEEYEMHSKSDNIEIMIYDKAHEVFKELFESLLNRYQIGLKTLMKDSDFIFVIICCITNVIINLKHGGLYI